MKTFFSKENRRYVIEVLAALVLVLLALIVPAREYSIHLRDMTWNNTDNVTVYENKVAITSDNEAGNSQNVSAGPFLKLPIGYYELLVDYKTDERENSVTLKSTEKNGAIRYPETKIEKFNNQLRMQFNVKEAVNDLEVVFNYCGKGTLTISSMKIITSKIHRFYALALVFVLLGVVELYLFFKKKKKQLRLEYYILAAGLLLAIIPLIGRGVFIGDDWVYHIARLESLADNFANGDFITKIHGKLADSYGYGTGFFYSDLFLIVPACLCYLGLPLEMSYKFFIFSILVIMLFVSYYTFNKFLKEKQIASILAVLMVNSHYLIMNLYGRTAVGEALGYVFIILTAAGLYNMVKEKFSQPYILIMGIAGVLLSHTISTIFAIIMAIVTALFYFRTIKKEKLFGKIAMSAVVTLLLTSWYWVPMVEQMLEQKLGYTKPWIWAYNQSQNVITTLGGGKIELGVFLTVVFIAGMIISYKIVEIRKWMLVTLVMLMVVSQEFFWIYTQKVTNVIQFPWRMLGVVGGILFIVLGLCLKQFPKQIPIIVIAAVLISFNFYCNISFFDEDTQRRDIVAGTVYAQNGELGGGKEWAPLAGSAGYERKHPNEAVGENGTSIQGSKRGLTFRFDYLAAENGSRKFEIPYLYYKGYVASFENQGREVPVPVTRSQNGLVQVDIPETVRENEMTTITVRYKYTMLTKISICVSIITCIAYIMWLVKKRKSIQDK